MIRKFLLIAVIVAASFQSANLQIYLAIMLIIFWYVLQSVAHPYAEDNLNRLERLSLMRAGFVTFCQLYFKFISSIPVLEIIVIIWRIIGNLIFLVYFVSYTTREDKEIEIEIEKLKTQTLNTFSPLAMLSARTKSFEKITSQEPEEELPSLPMSLRQIELEEPQDKSAIAEKVTLSPEADIKLIGRSKKFLQMVKGYQEPSPL